MFEDKKHSFLLCLVKSKTISKYLFYILFILMESHSRWRYAYALEHHTKRNYANMMLKIANEFYLRHVNGIL